MHQLKIDKELGFFFIPVVSPLGGRIEKEPNRLDICPKVISEMDFLKDYKNKPQAR